MQIEQQVCSLELAQELKKLGVKQDSCFYWIGFMLDLNGDAERWNLFLKRDTKGEEEKYVVSAYTVAELGEILPQKVCWRGYVNRGKQWDFEFGDKFHGPYYLASAQTEADARAKMLIYLIENNLIQL